MNAVKVSWRAWADASYKSIIVKHILKKIRTFAFR